MKNITKWLSDPKKWKTIVQAKHSCNCIKQRIKQDVGAQGRKIKRRVSDCWYLKFRRFVCINTWTYEKLKEASVWSKEHGVDESALLTAPWRQATRRTLRDLTALLLPHSLVCRASLTWLGLHDRPCHALSTSPAFIPREMNECGYVQTITPARKKVTSFPPTKRDNSRPDLGSKKHQSLDHTRMMDANLCMLWPQPLS